jgi:putative PEP-CTERM system TPR-repeat lipoprotein
MNKRIIASVITVVLSLSACNEKKTVEQLIASAHQYNEQGKFANAIIEYKNAVRLLPNNADARLGLGRAYLNQGNYVSAEKELGKAVELGSLFTQTVTLQAQVKTRLNKYAEVEELIKLSVNLGDNSYAIVLSYAGMSMLANNQVTKAQDYFAQASAINENDPYSKLSKAYLLYTENKLLQGLEIINDLLIEQESFSEALLLQGYIHFAATKFDLASDSFEQYLKHYPLDQNIRFFLVNSLIKAGKFNQADALTDKLLVIFKKSPLAFQYKAQIAYHTDDFLGAREFASKAIGIDERFVIAKMIAGVSSYKLNELEQAYDYLTALEGMLPVTHPINVILLSIKIKLGHTDDIVLSIAKLKKLKNSDSDTDLLQMTSVELMKIGDFASAQSLLNKASQVAPSNANIEVQRGALLLSQRDLSGIKSLEHALSIDPSLHDTELALARQYINENEITKAQQIADKWLQSANYQVSGNILNGLIAMQLEKVVDAERYFQHALKLEPNSISAQYNLASVAAYNKQIITAIIGFESVIKLNPNHHNAIRRYSVLQAREGGVAESISFLSALYDQSKLTSKTIHKNLVIGLAQNLRISEQVPAAIKLLESIKAEENLPARYWSVLADSYTQHRQFEAVLTTYEQAIKVLPRNYMLRVGYIGVLEKLQQFSKALMLTKVANIDFPHDDNLMIMLAYLELANNNLREAKQQLKRLENKGISNHIVIATTAKIAMQEKKYPLAIELYSDSYDQIQSSNNAINLARALQFSKQGSQAEAVLEKYLVDNLNDNRVRMLLAELYGLNNIDNKKSVKIINTYKTAITVQPNNVAALNNLAWQQYLNSDITNALLNIQKALKLMPNNIAMHESYGVILVANKNYDKAIDVIVSVINKGSEDVSTKVSLAEAYIATNQFKKANMILTGLSAQDSKLNMRITKLRQQVEKP